MTPTPRLQQSIRAKRHTSTCDQEPRPHRRRSTGVRTAPAPAGSAVGGIASAVVRKPTAGLPATTLRDSTSAGASVSKRSRRQPSSASSESSSESTSSSSESSDSEDTSSDSDRRHRRSKTEGQAAPETPSLCARSQLSSGLGFPLHLMCPDPGQAGYPEDKKG